MSVPFYDPDQDPTLDPKATTVRDQNIGDLKNGAVMFGQLRGCIGDVLDPNRRRDVGALVVELHNYVVDQLKHAPHLVASKPRAVIVRRGRDAEAEYMPADVYSAVMLIVPVTCRCGGDH